MYGVMRYYAGPGAKELFDVLEARKEEVETLIRGVNGLVSYSLIWLDNAGVSVTVCQDKAGCDQSVQLAAQWVRENVTTSSNPPMVSEGSVILQI